VKNRFTEPQIGAILKEREAGAPVPTPQTKGFQSPGLSHSIRNSLKILVGPPGLEPGTKGL
jgi:hypothetical protein